MHRVGIEIHQVFSALADPTRIRIIRLLLAAQDEVCLCELSNSLNEPEYKLSRHVKVLKSAGLLSSVRDGKWVYHGLVKDAPYLKTLFRAVGRFPDDSKISAKDVARFKKRLEVRVGGRCKTDSAKINVADSRRVNG